MATPSDGEDCHPLHEGYIFNAVVVRKNVRVRDALFFWRCRTLWTKRRRSWTQSGSCSADLPAGKFVTIHRRQLYSYQENNSQIAMFKFCVYRWVCEDFPELQPAINNHVLHDFDAKRYDLCVPGCLVNIRYVVTDIRKMLILTC